MKSGQNINSILNSNPFNPKAILSLVNKGLSPNHVHDGSPLLHILIQKLLIEYDNSNITAINNLENCISTLIINNEADPNKTNYRHYTALHNVMSHHNFYPNVAMLLVRKRAYSNTHFSGGNTVLHCMVHHLLKLYDSNQDGQNNTAIATQEKLIGELIINYEADADKSGKNYHTPLHDVMAHHTFHPRIAMLLVRNKANPNTHFSGGNALLHCMVHHLLSLYDKNSEGRNNDAIVSQENLITELILNHEADVNKPGKNYHTPLHDVMAHSKFYPRVAMLLARDGANRNTHFSGGNALIHCMVNYLLNLYDKNSNGCNNEAIINHENLITELIRNLEADVDKSGKNYCTPLHDVMSHFKFYPRIAMLLTRNGANRNTHFSGGNTVLHCMVNKLLSLLDKHRPGDNDSEISDLENDISTLVNLGADPNKGGKNYCTPLHDVMSHYRFHLRAAILLIRNHSNPDTHFNDGNSILHCLVREFLKLLDKEGTEKDALLLEEVILELLDAGAEPDKNGKHGTALHMVMANKTFHPRLACLLLRNGAHPNTTWNGVSIQDYLTDYPDADELKYFDPKLAITRELRRLLNAVDAECVQLPGITIEKIFKLLDDGASHFCTDSAGNTLLHLFAQLEDDTHLWRFLEKHHIDIEHPNKRGDSPLAALLRTGRPAFTAQKAVRLVTKLKANPNTAIKTDGNKVETTLLHQTVHDAEASLVLITFGANLETKDSLGRTPLAYLIETPGQIHQVITLLRAGANPNIFSKSTKLFLLEYVREDKTTQAELATLFLRNVIEQPVFDREFAIQCLKSGANYSVKNAKNLTVLDLFILNGQKGKSNPAQQDNFKLLSELQSKNIISGYKFKHHVAEPPPNLSDKIFKENLSACLAKKIDFSDIHTKMVIKEIDLAMHILRLSEQTDALLKEIVRRLLEAYKTDNNQSHINLINEITKQFAKESNSPLVITKEQSRIMFGNDAQVDEATISHLIQQSHYLKQVDPILKIAEILIYLLNEYQIHIAQLTADTLNRLNPLYSTPKELIQIKEALESCLKNQKPFERLLSFREFVAMIDKYSAHTNLEVRGFATHASTLMERVKFNQVHQHQVLVSLIFTNQEQTILPVANQQVESKMQRSSDTRNSCAPCAPAPDDSRLYPNIQGSYTVKEESDCFGEEPREDQPLLAPGQYPILEGVEAPDDSEEKEETTYEWLTQRLSLYRNDPTMLPYQKLPEAKTTTGNSTKDKSHAQIEKPDGNRRVRVVTKTVSLTAKIGLYPSVPKEALEQPDEIPNLDQSSFKLEQPSLGESQSEKTHQSSPKLAGSQPSS